MPLFQVVLALFAWVLPQPAASASLFALGVRDAALEIPDLCVDGIPPLYDLKQKDLQLASCIPGYRLRKQQPQRAATAAAAATWSCIPKTCPEPAKPPHHTHTPMAAKYMVPPPAWMSQYPDRRLQQLYLPGTHDSGTYKWTVPTHLPFILDGLAAMVFNIFEDLSATQRLTVYEQLQAGARVLDLRLAINPWLALAARNQNPPTPQSLIDTEGLFTFDPDALEGSLNLAAAGGPLSQGEVSSALVLSHSLPGAPLREVLQDIRRFLMEQPTEVVVVMVRADSVDVNFAQINRMTPRAWEVAAAVIQEEMEGIRRLNREEVEQQTLGELQSGAQQGSVVLYSNDLPADKLNVLCYDQLKILESWGNGTNTEEVPDLVDRIISWMSYWKSAGWAHNSSPYLLLLASAEVTLGVKTILQLIKNHIWLATEGRQRAGEQHGVLGSYQTLYALGAAANQQMLQQVFQNPQVVKAFNIWSLDAPTPDIISAILELNQHQPPSPS